MEEPLFPEGTSEEYKQQYRAALQSHTEQQQTHEMDLHQSRTDMTAWIAEQDVETLRKLQTLIAMGAAGGGAYWVGFVNALLTQQGFCPFCNTTHAPLPEAEPTPKEALAEKYWCADLANLANQSGWVDPRDEWPFEGIFG